MKQKANVQISDLISEQLRSLSWLQKPGSNDEASMTEALDPLIDILRCEPRVSMLLSKVFRFQKSITAIEGQNLDKSGKFV